jgi:hypothetical protein
MPTSSGGVFGLAIVVAVFSGTGSYASAAAFGDVVGPAIGVCAAFSLAGAVTASALPSRRRGLATAGAGGGPAPIPAPAQSAGVLLGFPDDPLAFAQKLG